MKITFEIDLLRTLIAFANTGSFKSAARSVFRSQPAVSMQMKRLEQLAGQKLFVRQGRDVVLTEQGRHLVIHARKLIADHDRLVNEIRGEEIGGEVRIGIPDDYASLVLPELLHQFDQFYPKVSLNILTNTSPVLADSLNKGELDLAVLATSAPSEVDMVLTTETIVWVGSRAHDRHLRRPLNLALFADDSPIYRRTIDVLHNAAEVSGDVIDFRVSVTSKSSAVLTTVAASGFAVATMAKCVVPDHLRILGADDGFPNLGDISIVLRASHDSQTLAATRVAQRIVDGFRQSAPL